jgi:hypothetical protein
MLRARAERGAVAETINGDLHRWRGLSAFNVKVSKRLLRRAVVCDHARPLPMDRARRAESMRTTQRSIKSAVDGRVNEL